MAYNRYSSFINNGIYKRIPFIEIPVHSTDYYDYYQVGKTRLDLLSYQYYGDPNYGWLILQANPSIGSLEFRILDSQKIRIPYPLTTAIQRYNDEIGKYDKLYGLN